MDAETKPVVFIHTNEKQFIGAKVAEYALRKFSPNHDLFDIQLITLADHPELRRYEGRQYYRNGSLVRWRNDDLQSFTPLRFLPPKLCAYWGRALVIDPDVFACADIYPLLTKPMGNYCILARIHPSGGYASSVMVLDCRALTHWRWEQDLEELFALRRDYRDWMSLRLEAPATVGQLEEYWNHYDTLNTETKLLHNTQRLTQPWKTGLKVDFVYDPPKATRSLFSRAKRAIRGIRQQHYQPHPDPKQENFFLSLLRESIADGTLSDTDLRYAVKHKNVRTDIYSLIER